MSAYYDKTKNLICIREQYSDVCEANHEVNTFFSSIRGNITTLSNGITELEDKIIKYMCDSNTIYPIEFSNACADNRANLVKKFVEIGCESAKVEIFVSKTLEILQNYKPRESIINLELDHRIPRRAQ